MDYVWYLFRFDGRINRARCWLAGLIIVCWMIFLALLMASVAHLFGAAVPRKISFGPNGIFNLLDPQFWRSLPSVNLTSALIHSVITPLALWVYLATSVKRLHDRDRNGWWIVPFFVLPCLYSQFGDRLENWLDSWLEVLPSSIVFVLSVWGFIEMYCLKGTAGTNRFGSDPLAPIDTRPPWDQQSEIEMVPHKGAEFPKLAFPRGDYFSPTSR